MVYSEFSDLIDYVDWNSFVTDCYDVEDYGWELHNVDGINYYIKPY